jgi:hypothetical protein
MDPDPDPQHWCPGADAGEAEDRDPRIVNAAGQRRNPISPSGTPRVKEIFCRNHFP